MSNKQKPSKTRRNSGIAVAICFSAAVIMAGTYALNGIQANKAEKLAEAEQAAESERANAKKLVINTDQYEENETKEDNDKNELNGIGVEEDSTKSEDTSEATAPTSGENLAINFSEQSQLLWPVDGNLLMGYSMDQTIYFATLDQYKYNPALIISGAEGDQVIAGAPGIVKSIDKTAQTGTTVNIDLGNGYEVFYGQLKDVPLNTGDYVAANTVVGYVAEPTKYYVAEGCNVYFEMRKDGQPVNPMEYMAE